MSIAELKIHIKGILDAGLQDWGLFGVVFLVGAISFGLGRISVLEDVRPPVALSHAPRETAPRALFVGGLYVASKSGSTYFYPWCSGATKIAVQNRIWFADEAAARRAGFGPSKSCKGLGNE